MATPTELDVFSRSLGGDRRARTELYKKFIHGNPRVTQVAAGSAHPTDFLHDCLTNLLRTGHSWDKEQSLVIWAESVALWTALANERTHDMHTRSDHGEVRMCADIEGEDANQGAVLKAYAPPLLLPEDSAAARILDLLNDTEKIVFRKCAMENASWQETAEAAGKPLDGIGQIFSRAIGRVVRLFGAPPPLNDDLAPVISRVFAKPSIPEGRAISMQLDTAFYRLTPEMYSIGLKTASEARIVVLWDAARQDTPPETALRGHLGKCHYCADVLRAMLRVQNALTNPPGAEFRLCPGAFTLSDAREIEHVPFNEHLAQCAVCNAERTQVLEGLLPGQDAEQAKEEAAHTSQNRIIWGLVAMLVLILGSLVGFRYYSRRPAPVDTSILDDKAQPTVTVDLRYKDLVQDIGIDDARIFASVLPANRAALKHALDQFSIGQADVALMISAGIAKKGDDPAAAMIYAMSLFKYQMLTDAYREMKISEAMTPRDSLRCWVLLQFSLVAGDREIIEREVKHLSNDPRYGAKAKYILDNVRARK